MSELFGLKWTDVNFCTNEINVTRSIVMQVVGHCKTEAFQKPIPLDPYLAEALQIWRQHTQYRAADDFGSSPAQRARAEDPTGGNPSCAM
jgi:integrase